VLKLNPPTLNLKQAGVGASQFQVKLWRLRTLQSDDFSRRHIGDFRRRNTLKQAIRIGP
jgi:hypothetical protein